MTAEPDLDEELEEVEAQESPLDELRELLTEREAALAAAEKEVTRLRREHDRLQSRQQRTEDALRRLDERLEHIAEARDSLREWSGERSPSFAWQLLERLAVERRQATQDLDALTDIAAAPLGSSIPRPSELQDRFMKRVITAFSVIGGVLVLLIAVSQRSLLLSGAVSPFNPFSWALWVQIVVALGAFLVVWCLLLIGYYKENSTRRQELTYLGDYVEFLSKAGLTVRQETQRLDALHAQVPEYLRYLSEVLHRPWEQPAVAVRGPAAPEGETTESPESLVFDTSRARAEYLPSFVRLAECPRSSGSDAESALVRETVRELLHPGWRYGVLERLLGAVERTASMASGSFTPDRLDRDPMLRANLMARLMAPDARILAGREQLRDLAARIQLFVMDAIHPPVREIGADPLENLELDDDLLGSSDWRLKDWDSFLAESLGDASEWGTAQFSIEGRQGIPEVSSTGFGPERLADEAAPSVTYSALAEKSVRPVELVVRVDRTEATLGPAAFSIFEEHAGRSASGGLGRSDAAWPHGDLPTASTSETQPVTTDDSLA